MRPEPRFNTFEAFDPISFGNYRHCESSLERLRVELGEIIFLPIGSFPSPDSLRESSRDSQLHWRFSRRRVTEGMSQAALDQEARGVQLARSQ